MNFLKKIFSNKNNNNKVEVVVKDGIFPKAIYKNPNGEIEIDFDVPSKKLFLVAILTDGFTKEKTVRFRQVSSYGMDKLLTWGDGDDFVQLNIGFRNVNGQDFLIFSTYQKSLKFYKGDKIAFLFNNQEIKEYELLEKGYRIDQDNEGVIIESMANITKEDINRFSTIKTNKWRHLPSDDRKPKTGTLGQELQNDLFEMTRVYKYIFDNPIE